MSLRVGPSAGVAAEAVGQHRIGGRDEIVVGFGRFGSDLLRCVHQRVGMGRGDATGGEPFLDFGHFRQLFGYLR